MGTSPAGVKPTSGMARARVRRKAVAAALGALAGGWLSGYLVETLPRLPAWAGLVAQSPQTVSYVRWAAGLPFPPALAVIALGALTLLEVHGIVPAPKSSQGKLSPYPFDPHLTQLVLGEEHNRDGTRSETPTWRCLPEKGMCTGILITGATGSAKTSAAQYPYTAQLVRLHADDPERKLGGLIIDAKGNYADFVRQQCLAAGRLADYYEVSLDSGVRYNIISRPDLEAPALGGHIGDMLTNVQGDSYSDPFWPQSAKELATQVIRAVRLSQSREPTMADLYRLATDGELFDSWLDMAREHVDAGTIPNMEPEAAAAEYRAIEFWKKRKWDGLDPKLKASIAAGLNNACSLFDVETLRRAFCPSPEEENFLGFDELIASGKIVTLRLPYSRLKTVSQIVGTMAKLNFFDAVLNRLAQAEANGSADVGRLAFFVADEYDGYVTQPGDGAFLAKCREAKCCTIIATQSYESLVAKLKNEHVAAQLIANLRSKLWLCAEDNYTARHAADLCGEVEKEKISHNRSENVQSAYSFVDGKFVSSDPGSLGEGTSVSLQREHLFPPRAFTSLKLNQAIVKLFDGSRVLEPRLLYLKPVYENPNVSWFETPPAEESV